MARFKYGAIISDISGSIGGLTLQKNSSGNTLRSKPLPLHSRNVTQLERRAFMKSLQSAWSALSDADRKSWKQFVAYSGQSILADSDVLISGYNLFLKYQFCRLLYNLPLMSSFQYIPMPQWPVSFLVFSNADQLFAQFFTTLAQSDYFFILQLSNPRPASRSYSPVNCRFMFCNPTSSDTFTFTSSYQKIFGILPVSGDTLHYSIYYFSLRAPILSGFRTGKLIVGEPVTRSWVDVASTALTGYTAIAFGNGLFIAITQNIGGVNYATSIDGSNWTYRSSGINGIMMAICWNATYWVLVTSEGVGHTTYSSADGITWASMDNESNQAWGCVASVGVTAIALTRSPGFPFIGTSIVNSAFNYNIFPWAASFRGICYGNGIWVAVSDTNPNHYILSSTDGITWIQTFSTPPYGWSCVAFGNGIFVAGNQRTDGNNFAISSDGLSWSISDSAPFGPIFGITFADSQFVAVGDCTNDNFVLSSVDGLNWIVEPIPVAGNYWGVASDGSIFVAVSHNSTAIIVSQ